MPRPWFTLVAALSLFLVTGKNASAQSPDHSTQIAVIFEDVVPVLQEFITCRMSQRYSPTDKYLNGIGAALAKANLAPDEIKAHLDTMKNVKPLLGDDRSIAEALVFCDSRGRDTNKRYDMIFDLEKNIAAVAAEPPGRDDVQIRQVMQEIWKERNASKICGRHDTGPFPPGKPIDPASEMGKQLARFDISPTMRAYIDRQNMRDVDFTGFQTIGELRKFCEARSAEIMKAFEESKKTKKPMPSVFDKFKALQPIK